MTDRSQFIGGSILPGLDIIFFQDFVNAIELRSLRDVRQTEVDDVSQGPYQKPFFHASFAKVRRKRSSVTGIEGYFHGRDAAHLSGRADERTCAAGAQRSERFAMYVHHRGHRGHREVISGRRRGDSTSCAATDLSANLAGVILPGRGGPGRESDRHFTVLAA